MFRFFEKPLPTTAHADSAGSGGANKKTYTLMAGASGLTMAEIVRRQMQICYICQGRGWNVSLDMEKALAGELPFSMVPCDHCGGTGRI